MYVVHIPYYDEEDQGARLASLTYDTLPTLREVCIKLFHERRLGYLDETYTSFSDLDVLKKAVEEHKILEISVFSFDSKEKPQHTFWRVQDIYEALCLQQSIISFLSTTNEIILSSHLLYQEEMNRDHIYLCVDGIERFLFSFCSPSLLEETTLDTFIPTGIAPFYDSVFVLSNPLHQEEDILAVFEEWAATNHLVVTGKSIRLADETDFIRRPFVEELLEQDEQDPTHQFSIPSEYCYWFFAEKIPPLPEVIEKLKHEKAGTIACVIDEFKDETIQTILEQLDESLKQNVIQLLPQIPCTSYEKRKRFTQLFSYDPAFIAERLQVLQPRYTQAIQKKPGEQTSYDKDVLCEYQLWQEFSVSNKKSPE